MALGALFSSTSPPGGPTSKALPLNPTPAQPLQPRVLQPFPAPAPNAEFTLLWDLGVRGKAGQGEGPAQLRRRTRLPNSSAGARGAASLAFAAPLRSLSNAVHKRQPGCARDVLQQSGCAGLIRESRIEGRREEWGGWRARGCSSSPPRGSVWFLFSVRPSPGLGFHTPHALPKRSLRPRGLPHVEFLLFLDLQIRWITTPLEHVNRGSSFLNTTPQTCWGTSLSLFEERPTEGLDVT